MNEIEKYTQKLVEAILASDTYREFRQAGETILGQPEKKKHIDEFRKKAFQLQNADSSLDLYETITWVADEAEAIRKDPEADLYLGLELKLCRMMQQINMELVKAMNLDLEDIVDQIL